MKKKLISAIDFDTIHLASLAAGGIGAGAWTENIVPVERDDAVPLCALGARMVAEGRFSLSTMPYIGFRVEDNDRAVWRINHRLGKRGAKLNDRVPFMAWVKEMNIDIAPETEAPAPTFMETV